MNFRNSLKGKLVVIFILVLLVPVLTVTYTFIKTNTSYIREVVYDQNMNLAKSLHKQIKLAVDDTESVMDMLSTLEEVESMNPSKMDGILKGIVADYDAITQIYIMDPSGMQIYKTSGSLGDRSDRGYFQAAIKGETHYSKVIISRSQKKPIVVLAKPIKRDGNIVGVIGASIELSFISELASQVDPGKSGYGYVVGRTGKVIGHPDDKLVKEMIDVSNLDPVKKVINGKHGTEEYTYKGVNKLAAYMPFEKTGWGIVVQLPAKEAFKEISKQKRLSIIIIVVAVLLAIGISLGVSNYITKPIVAAMEFADKIANGNLNIDSLQVKTQDEIGDLTHALNEMRINLKDIVVNLLDAVEDLSAYSEELSASAEEGNATIETTSQLIDDMSSSIQQISASSQEVTGLAQEANSQTQIGGQKIESTVESIEEINQAVGSTVDTIEELDNNSQEIGQIVELITDIADQTNLLALNAAIEAARAGEHGQGFAVVAEEIRELAEETAKATNEISGLIKDTQKKSKAGLGAVQQVENKAQRGKTIVQETGEVFSKIKHAIEETSAHIQQTAASTQNLAENSDQVAEASDGVRNMSDEVTKSSQELASMAQQLQELVDTFDV
ncbi:MULTISPECIES: methyl-accepting chemotaxis protein [unclassified Candidatus Frackibacter]|uniref:methyl-accepting chemotaxis protein n=1 Tax=unclassified Candidatus Frackibacter TaxID=2648818 RepID=UPI00088C4A66|nr:MULTISPECIES: methyl-accepting chemotaxis protein [unclassified Candidatus Frackibacter]SDC68897.1 methyl-accepting chemotaxis sensory transducer with Cache sensor [Candidatus Frackibacter sp. WG11]SEM82823.1 methyl-accepting chemotaxis sensory transducer with Cache sensor [Candidatus Frackibacter sp. WG12]SFL92482.1 methyl-accepting chemotaxis sensory transducer with Cache sensor [Candidatus Frackibacter sp. WG13]